MMQEPAQASYSYLLDAQDRITDVSPAWVAFACENEGPELTAERVVGRSLMEFIQDGETRQLYHVMLSRVRQTGRPIIVQFRCDGPAVRRYMELEIEPVGVEGLRLTGRLLRTEPRFPVGLFDSSRPRSEEVLVVCSWCKQVRVEGDWVEVEEAVRRLGLFDEIRMPRLSHGICPRCDAHFREEYGFGN